MPWLLKVWNSLINTSNEKCNIMPVQINEVIIKAVVDSQATSANDNAPAVQSNIPTKELEIIEKFLEIIKEKKER